MMHFVLRSCDADGLLPNKSVSVQNSCQPKSPDGEPSIAKAYAYRPDDSEQGKLKIRFNLKVRFN